MHGVRRMARWTAADVPDQTDRVAVITGANSGLGLETARVLAGRGATVILGCRSRSRGAEARADILRDHPDAHVEILEIDVASLESVADAAAALRDSFKVVDLLVLNAGIMATPRRETVDGFESQLATNHLGHFAFTGHLLGALDAVPAARVVHVSSLAAHSGTMRFDDLMHTRGYSPFSVYAQSKLANQLFAFGLQRRLAAAGSSTVSLAAHPGFAQTNLMLQTAGLRHVAGIVRPFVGMFWNDAARGALPQLYAATSPDAVPGGYYGPDGLGERAGWPVPARVAKGAQSEDTADRLWVASEALTGVRYLS